MSAMEKFDPPKKRLSIPFTKIESAQFTKSGAQLSAYNTDIRDILTRNSVKSIQESEDQKYWDLVDALVTAPVLVGDWIYTDYTRSRVAEVVAVSQEMASLRYLDNGEYTQARLASCIPALCKNCRHGRSAHADNGKCFYGPTSWEGA